MLPSLLPSVSCLFNTILYFGTFSKLKSICALAVSVACVILFVFACPDIISYFNSSFSTYVLNFISVLLAE